MPFRSPSNRQTNMAPNMSVKTAPFGRWTPQYRGAFYLSRYVSKGISL